MARTPQKALLTASDIAAAMDISLSVVNAWFESGALPSINIGSGTERAHRRVARTTFQRFLNLRSKGIIP